MASFPKTYGIVRDGRPTTVAVSDAEALLALRTELELVRQLGTDEPPAVQDVLRSRLRRLDAKPEAAAASVRNGVADMCAILADARAPANGLAIACIDADFPQIREALNMASIRKERKKFRDDVAAEIRAAGQEDELAAASGGPSPSDAGPAQGPEDLLADADQLAAAISAADTDSQPSPAGAAASLVTAERELAEIADDFEAAASQLDELTDSLGQEVGTPESLMEPAEPAWDDALAEAEAELAGLALPADRANEDNPIADDQNSEAGAAGQNEATHGDLTSWLDGEKEAIEGSCTDLADDIHVDPGEPPVDLADLVAQAAEAEPVDPMPPFADAGHLVDGTVACSPMSPPAASLAEQETPRFCVEDKAVGQGPQPHGDFRRQLAEIKATLTDQMDRLGGLMTASEQLHERAEQTMRQAEHLRAAARQAHDASCRYSAVQSEADQARAVYEQAQHKAAQARNTWEAAQQAADEAARRIEGSA